MFRDEVFELGLGNTGHTSYSKLSTVVAPGWLSPLGVCLLILAQIMISGLWD